MAEEHWPQQSAQAAKDGGADEGVGDNEETEDLEKAIQKEVQSMKRPRKEHRFSMYAHEVTNVLVTNYTYSECPDQHTMSYVFPSTPHQWANIPLVIYVACKPPIEPAIMISKYMQEVESSGISRMR